MPYPASPALPLTPRQQSLLQHQLNKATVTKREAFRIQIILNGASGMSNEGSAKSLSTDVEPVKKWRTRWLQVYPELLVFEAGHNGNPPSDPQLLKRLLSVFMDAPRSGRKAIITVEQKQQIVALACEKPSDYGLPYTKWTHDLLREKAIEKGIVEEISADYLGVILKKNWLAFIEQQVMALEADEKVVFLMDQLNTHKSASLVRWVAGQIGYTHDLGRKGLRGILKNQDSRMEFLERADHDIRFIFTPKHCSWLNPIENWFARLSRSALKGLSVDSLEQLEEKVVSYITYYNGCLAKAFNWTFDGFDIDRPLAGQRR